MQKEFSDILYTFIIPIMAFALSLLLVYGLDKILIPHIIKSKHPIILDSLYCFWSCAIYLVGACVSPLPCSIFVLLAFALPIIKFLKVLEKINFSLRAKMNSADNISSIRTELSEYKKLVDEELITESDYEKKKKEILGFSDKNDRVHN